MSEKSAKSEPSLMSKITALCKRRGFIYPASEIYGGLNGFWDFGPLGVQLKNNLRDIWWRDMVECPPLGPDGKPLSIVGLDSSIIQHPRTWEASGHVGGFADLMVDCRASKKRYRADHVLVFDVRLESEKEEYIRVASMEDDIEAVVDRAFKIAKKTDRDLDREKNINAHKIAVSLGDRSYELLTDLSPQERAEVYAPDTYDKGTLTEPRPFNLMFHSYTGVFQDEDSKVYLRPETAQGIFLNYKNILDTSRVKIPFGVAQVGKSFRNEVTPRNFIFRTREFEQMEMEFFCPPEDGMMWYEFWVSERMKWWENLGVKRDNLYRHIIPQADLSHYSRGTSDIEYRYPFTHPNFGELEGVAYRTDYDLTQHQLYSRVNLEYIEPDTNKRYIPHVVEPASGLTRGVLVLLCEAYRYDESRASPEWLDLQPRLAPIKAGIFPLVNKDGMTDIAEKLFMSLRPHMTCQFDAKQSIGKRYARMDEAGTPFCITVDGETSSSGSVTIRSRNTAQQERVALDSVHEWLRKNIEKE